MAIVVELRAAASVAGSAPRSSVTTGTKSGASSAGRLSGPARAALRRRNAQGPLQGKWIEKSGLHRHSFSALPIGGKLHHFETNIYYRLQTMAIEDAEGRGET
jgi:hypothetical protein